MAYLLSNECSFLLLEILDVLQETHLTLLVRDDLLQQGRILLSEGLAFGFIFRPLDSVPAVCIKRLQHEGCDSLEFCHPMLELYNVLADRLTLFDHSC